jgi:hypothetical protein
LLSIIIYAATIGVNFNDDVGAKQVEAFGPAPLGLPVTVFVVLLETLLYLPMPWVFLHGMRIIDQAMQDRRLIGLGYLFSVGGLHPHLVRSQRICLGGLLYFVALCAAWIAYAAAKGI